MKIYRINNIIFNYALEFELVVNKKFQTLISYCESIGITIPRYCYDPQLSIAGNCRMCVIELKDSLKPLISCTASSKSCLYNNSIFTSSPLIKKARENVLEFLLLNHPLDCPICDQGGECDLQDQSFVYGLSTKRFYSFKRGVTNKNISPLIKTVMTRCIHCTKCVRFCAEIASTSELGMFGRGFRSEISTYISNKVFQSELSGNVIDLCPVGALTSKPYPFTERSWELKSAKSIDFTDGVGAPLRVYLKNNKVIKINAGFNNNSYLKNWITDKIRFSFDGMFSEERLLKIFLLKMNSNSHLSVLWENFFKEIVLFLYFKDHLTKHFYVMTHFVIIFDSNINLENLNLLLVIEKNFKFIKLRQSNPCSIPSNLETEFLFHEFVSNNDDLIYSQFCLLLGVNTRYEASSFNLNLKKRINKGNFEMASFSSFIHLTFFIKYCSLNFSAFYDFVDGNSYVCQNFIKAVNPFVIVGSNIYKRNNSKEALNLLNSVYLFITTYLTNLKPSINLLNSTVNGTGINYIKTFAEINENDLLNSTGFYFINVYCLTNSLIKKLVNMKSLNYFNNFNIIPFKSVLYLDQNEGIKENFSNEFIIYFNVCSYINLPNSVFFEETGTYMNTEGFLKQNVKFISTKKQTKSNWHIIRKFFSKLKHIAFLTVDDVNTVCFNGVKELFFKLFGFFLSFPVINLKSINYFKNVKPNLHHLIRQKSKLFKKQKLKNFKTIIKMWLDTFYDLGKNLCISLSSIIIKCFLLLKKTKNNFEYLH